MHLRIFVSVQDLWSQHGGLNFSASRVGSLWITHLHLFGDYHNLHAHVFAIHRLFVDGRKNDMIVSKGAKESAFVDVHSNTGSLIVGSCRTGGLNRDQGRSQGQFQPNALAKHNSAPCSARSTSRNQSYYFYSKRVGGI